MNKREVVAYLGAEKQAVPISAARGQIGKCPGLYAIFVSAPSTLPHPFSSRLIEKRTRLLYVGRAKDSLYARLCEQELQHKSAATFFRGLGAVLGYRPASGSLLGMRNQYNYRFTDEDTAAVIQWIEKHVAVRWMALGVAETVLLESLAIMALQPLFNAKHNPDPSVELATLRRECRRVARRSADSRAVPDASE
jgi:hypothetical protein